jgi:FKBP-type peptidyl-prolyl cis-trans isomerase FklB
MTKAALFAVVLCIAATVVVAKDMDAYHKRTGAKFLADKEKEAGVFKLPSGMLFKVLAKGNGDKSPGPNDDCDVHYKGTLRDGTKFDSSYDRGSPATFKPTQVIKGWTEALQLMREGDKWEVYIPYELAYGARGSPPKIPAFAPLTFEMELIKVKGTGKTAAAAAAELKQLIGKTHDEL